MTSFLKTAALFAAVSSLSVSCLSAKSASDSPTLQQEIASATLEEIIVTANRSSQSWLEAQQTIALLTGPEILATGATHINEIAQRIPGAWISRGNGQEHLTAIRSPVLTGAGGCGAFLMSQDSIPLRASGFCNVNELFESASELADRIEVIKGPGSAAHGSNAVHGMIQITTPMPGRNRRMSQFELGPHEYQRIKHITIRERIVVALSGTTDGGYKDDSGFDQQKFVLKHGLTAGNFDVVNSLAMTNLNQETSGFVQGDDAYRDAALKTANPNPEAFRDVRSLRLISDWQASQGDLRFTPYFRWTDMAFLQHFLPGQPLEENGHHSFGVQSLAQITNSLRVGLDLEHTRAFLKQTQADVTQGSPFLVATLPQGKHYDYEVSANIAAVFAQFDYPVTDGLNLSFGLRGEQVRYDYDNRMIAGRTQDDGTPCGFGGCRYTRPEDQKDQFTNLSPKAGFSLTLGDQVLFGQLSQGFRAPQATELYRLQNGQNIASIDSESVDNIELGLRGDGSRFRYQISIYRMQKDNFIFQDTSRANVDNGQTRHQGLEFEARFALTDQLSLSAAWTLARHRYDNNPALARTEIKGNDIDTAPRSMGALQLSYAPSEAFSGELEWSHIGPYFTNPENSNRYGGHDLLHLRGDFRLNSSWSLFFRVTNLLDTDYAERADFAFGSERYFVGEPRSYFLGIRRSN